MLERLSVEHVVEVTGEDLSRIDYTKENGFIFYFDKSLKYFEAFLTFVAIKYEIGEYIGMSSVDSFLERNDHTSEVFKEPLQIALKKVRQKKQPKARLVEKSENGQRFFSMVFCDEQ